MAKGKGKGKGKDKGKSVPNRDNYARISYLYQISNQFYLAHPEYQALSRGYNRNLDLIAKNCHKTITTHKKDIMQEMQYYAYSWLDYVNVY